MTYEFRLCFHCRTQSKIDPHFLNFFECLYNNFQCKCKTMGNYHNIYVKSLDRMVFILVKKQNHTGNSLSRYEVFSRVLNCGLHCVTGYIKMSIFSNNT